MLSAYEKWGHVSKKWKLADLTNEEKGHFFEVVATIASQRERVVEVCEGEVVGDFLVLNGKGTRPPIFWCFNSWAEPLILSKKLGPEQPLVAMHSLHKFVDKWRTKTRFHGHMVLRYLETILDLNDMEKVVVGGNCQGAPLAEALAITLKSQYQLSPLLITVDYIPQRKFTGQTCLIYGKNSSFNPFNTKIDPVPIFEKLLVSFTWSILDANHGEYFKDPTIDELTNYISLASNNFIESNHLENSGICDTSFA